MRTLSKDKKGLRRVVDNEVETQTPHKDGDVSIVENEIEIQRPRKG